MDTPHPHEPSSEKAQQFSWALVRRNAGLITIETMAMSIMLVMVLGGGFMFLVAFSVAFGLSVTKATGRMRFLTKPLYVTLFLLGYSSNTPLFLYIYASGVQNLALTVVLSIASGYACQRFKIFNISWINGTTIAGIGWLFVMMAMVNIFSPSRCDAADGFTRHLVDYPARTDFLGPDNIPRYFTMDPEEATLVVANRVGGMSQPGDAKDRRPIFIIDMDSGELLPVGIEDEVSSVRYDEVTDSFIALTFIEPFSPDSALYWFDRNGTVTKKVPLGSAGDLYSHLFLTDRLVVILSSDPPIIYDREQDATSLGAMPPSSFGGSLTAGTLVHYIAADRTTRVRENRAVNRLLAQLQRKQHVPAKALHDVTTQAFFFAYGGGLIEHLIAPGVFRTSFRNDFKELTGQIGVRFLGGSTFLGYDPPKEEVYSVQTFAGSLDILDYDLNPKRQRAITNCMRTFHLDPERRIGVAPDYITGDLVLFQLDGLYQETVAQIGKRSRALYMTASGTIVVGSACGIFTFDASDWPPVPGRAPRPDASSPPERP